MTVEQALIAGISGLVVGMGVMSVVVKVLWAYIIKLHADKETMFLRYEAHSGRVVESNLQVKSMLEILASKIK